MGKREKIKEYLHLGSRSARPSRAPSPQPIPDRTPSTTPSVPSKPAPPADEPVEQPTTKSPPEHVEKNPALEKAFETHINNLPEGERKAFLHAGKDKSANNLLLEITTLDDKHKKDSRIRTYVGPLSNAIQLLDRFLNGISFVTQFNPEISSVVIGGVRLVLSIAIGFLSFFDKLSGMICRFGDFMKTLDEYAKSAGSVAAMHECLVMIYGDLLMFCMRTREVFVDASGEERKRPTWKVFQKFQWDWDGRFGSIETDLGRHLEALQHASIASILGKVLSQSRDENARRDRELAQDRVDMIDWISSASYEEKHQIVKSKKHPGTGEWLIETNEFKEWLDKPKSALLWCHGKPGAGKSVLASNVIETINQKYAEREEVGICFAYCDYKQETTRDFSQLVLGLMKQLCYKAVIPHDFVLKKQYLQRRTTIANLYYFSEVATSLEEVFILIDALDEFPEEQRHEVLGFLKGLVNQLPRAKVFVTSRRERDITEVFERLKTPIISVEARNVNADIEKYVRSEVHRLRTGDNGQHLYVESDTLLQKIVRTLTDKADGMFLWVNLQLANLCEASELRNDDDVEEALDELPTGLDETYLRIVDQIGKQPKKHREVAFKCLMWVFYAARPLTTRELQQAIDDSKPYPEEVILQVCANLLTTVPARDVDFEIENTFRPVHYSAQEFFTTQGNIPRPGCGLVGLSQEQANHQNIAARCMGYLDRFLNRGPWDLVGLSSFLDEFPFAWYAAVYFDHHAKRGLGNTKDLSDALLSQLNTFLKQDGLASLVQLRNVPAERSPSLPNSAKDFIRPQPVDATFIVYCTQLYELPYFEAQLEGTSAPPGALHRATVAGLSTVVKRILDAGVDVNKTDDVDETALNYAARNGDEEILKLLVDNGAELNALCGKFGAALHNACAQGHKTVVQWLLNQGGEVRLQGGKYSSPLALACRSNNIDVVTLVLDAGADVNASGGEFGTALHTAVYKGNKGVVQILLGHGADVNAPGGDYGNALQAAAYRGILDIVLTLIDHGADVNASGGEYGSALQAASHGRSRQKIVRLLLQYGAHVNAAGGRFGSALQAAADRRTVPVVTELLNAGADVNAGGGEYGSPLQAAAFRRSVEMVDLLLDRGADATFRGGRYGTALQAAIIGGFIEEEVQQMVNKLLDAGVDVSTEGGEGGSALAAAEQKGYEQVVQLLFSRGAKRRLETASSNNVDGDESATETQ